MSDKKVWFVTGASKGFGYDLVSSLLQKGNRVIATSRTIEKLTHLEKGNPDFLALTMDLINEQNVMDAIQKGIAHFGKIDVVVNNAGYGLFGTLEEFSTTEIKNCFDVNVFGVIHVSKAIIPHFRMQKSGMLLNIASVSGSVSGIGSGVYSATKAAVIQLSEALSAELDEFGVKVIAVCPGGFRTDFLDTTSLVTAQRELEEYTAVRARVKRLRELNKGQGGDPKKAVEVFIQLAEMPNPPTRIYMGSDALRMMDAKINSVVDNINQHRSISVSTDVDL